MYLRRHNLRKAIVRISLVLFVLFNTLDILHVQQRLARGSASLNSYKPGSERIFIASILWNNEAILRSSLSAALVTLAEHLGPKNVFISIHESGSWDETKNALRELDEALEQIGVERKITTSNVTHFDEISVAPEGEGWVDTPQGQKELRRIPYLAKQRNVGLEPLEELAQRGILFDKILLWESRIRRLTTSPVLKANVVASRVRKWKEEDPRNEELGDFCLINEMQVLRKIGQLLITCHYEKCKPEWMDGSTRQEEMAERIKREVKEKAPHRRESLYDTSIQVEYVLIYYRNRDSGRRCKHCLRRYDNGIEQHQM
ncbi:uncharacterized protein N0V89_005501 [Didymosphaeria variabile]|uniref:Glycosyltransferase family 69 protein n=1 Tax=Didymosphaeria variabile TaxID=1932322 RepID=A0A9W8XLF6_9PLEO|nr:uncharacterized protein N0V89_005501 [Didymosphaeria variabile]KAJ4353771.1 hypothetical protein N0V89_005501 [Didymosphaeria variabile]